MQAALILLPQILAMLPTITVGVEHLINWIGSLRAAAKQTREWTEELETAFLEALLASRTDPAWQLDPDPVTGSGVEGTKGT